MIRHLIATSVLVAAITPLHAQERAFLGKTATQWSAQLRSKDAKERRSAAFALGKMGPSAVPALAALKAACKAEKDAKVKDAMVFALGEICRDTEGPKLNDRELEPLFVSALAEPDGHVRRSAVYALGCLGSKSADTRRALETALGDRDAGVRQNAAWALGQYGTDVLPLLKRALNDADSLVKRDAASALLQMDDADKVHELLKDLLPLCRDASSEVRRATLNVLVRVVNPKDTEAIPPLVAAMDDTDVENRRNAALALSNIGGEETAKAVPILLEAIKNGDSDLRRQSCLAIRNIGAKAAPAVPEMVRLLRDDPDVKMREHAALALGGIGAASESAIPALVAKIKDKSEKRDVRVECAMALSRIGPVNGAVAVVPELLTVLGDPQQESKVRERVMWSLRVHGEKLASMNGVRDTFTRCVKEPTNPDIKMLRYDCAYMLGMVWQKEAPDETLGVLHEYLLDKSIQIFVGVSSDVTGSSTEIKGGKATVKVRSKGDGRIMAADALQRMGPTRYGNRLEIIRQLQLLADDANTYEPLRKKAAALVQAAK